MQENIGFGVSLSVCDVAINQLVCLSRVCVVRGDGLLVLAEADIALYCKHAVVLLFEVVLFVWCSPSLGLQPCDLIHINSPSLVVRRTSVKCVCSLLAVDCMVGLELGL